MRNHSFAVVAYMDSPYLTECLMSLKNQTIQSDIFISTSTPSPYLVETANKFGVELYITDSKQGIANDWNFALHKAKTKFVTLAHQDDVYLPEYAERCLQHAMKRQDTLICFTGYSEIVNGQERKNSSLLNVKKLLLGVCMPFKKNIRSKFFKRSMLSLGNPIPAPGVMYNLELLKGFQFSNQFSINLDWYAWLEMSRIKGRFIYIPTILFKHRIHAGSETTAGLKANSRQSEDLKMLKMFWPSWFAKWLAKFYARSYASNEIKQP